MFTFQHQLRNLTDHVPTSVSIFFVPYILLEVPSNVILKKFKRPSTYLGILVVSWGITMTFTGLCKDFGGLMACRVVLAICEAGFFPGAVRKLSHPLETCISSSLQMLGLPDYQMVRTAPSANTYRSVLLRLSPVRSILRVTCLRYSKDEWHWWRSWLGKHPAVIKPRA